MDSLNKYNRVLITGGTGSLGWALTKKILTGSTGIRIFSRDEKKQYDMKKIYPECEYVLGDIRDPHAVEDVVRDIDVIIHGASLKYVNISEVQPAEYVSTNIVGTMNVMNAVLANGNISRVVGISSDKACLPVNAYGLTKAVLEKLILEGGRRQGQRGTCIFNVARYGNVVGTRGSVVPYWAEQRELGLPLPITNPDMTRFFFMLDEAVDLINYSLKSPTGVILSKRMSSCTLGDLAEVMKGDAGVIHVGERPGEKKHEMLLSEDEMSRTTRSGEIFIYDPNAPTGVASSAYGSENARRLTSDELKTLIEDWL